jgi:acyl transferase domain-containing protein
MNEETKRESIAIIGMAGRFPGAPNVRCFWEKLRDGENCITFFSEEELLAQGVPPDVLDDPLYVRARGILDDVAGFDAKFFGFSPREADITDPQQRLFLESCWEALEDAACAPSTFPGRIGVFGGASWSTYFFDLYARPDLWRALGAFQLAIGNEKDHLTTRVSYKLNLRGPAVTVQTACSSSMVAVTLACQSLAAGQCDVALAGGVSLSLPQKIGYLYQEGGILCPDGYCRAFDAEAKGTIGGNGVGVVVLKRLGDAIADRDPIRAVIRGWAINNDGSGKVGYTAPSIAGQAEAIAAAQQIAGVTPDNISYVEAHGTGTPLGDPIEVAALTDAFRRGTDRVGYCAIGSVKTNIGHLDAAAGIAGLIKTTLALEHKTLPPSLHFRAPNPDIPFATSPFFVNAERAEWPANGTPRRAGVSSFGIGGTNAHVVVEEAPAPVPSGPSRPEQLLVLSAQTATALETMTANLGAHLAAHPEANLADVAYTLQAGRTELAHRRVIVCRTSEEAVAECRRPNGALMGVRPAHPPRTIFLFPGQGSQHAGMMAGLYASEPTFRAHVDALLATLDGELGSHLRALLTTFADLDADATMIAQPALFIVEYALAQLLREWGIVPDAVIGHSVGELTAAALAGVFSPADALQLVATRGKLMQELPRGKMLAVPLAEQQVRAILTGELSLAAVNGPEICVVSGPADAVDRLERELRRRGVAGRTLRTSHAFHSAAMDPIVAPFAQAVAAVPRNAPRLPVVSNVSGQWLDAATAADPHYWGMHIRETVRFADGLRTVIQDDGAILLEVGPGQVLTALAGRHPSRTSEHLVLASGRHLQDSQSDTRALLTALGRLWIAGAPVSWSGFARHERRRRVSLPTYPFERQRHWVDPLSDGEEEAAARPPAPSRARQIADWLYVPTWTRKPAMPRGANGAAKTWLLFADDEGCADAVAARLADEGHSVAIAKAAKKFARTGDRRYTVAPNDAAGYAALLDELQRDGLFPDAIAHFWGVTRTRPAFARAQERGFHSLLHLARALGGHRPAQPMTLSVVTTNLFDVRGDETVHPEKATILGPCKVIPQERPHLRFRAIDVASADASAELLHDELLADIDETVVALRGRHRWVQAFEPRPLERRDGAALLVPGGCYLITGGRGRIGSLIAEFLAETIDAKLVLVGRSPASDNSNPNVLNVVADSADDVAMKQAIANARARFGRIDGVIHAAGLTGGEYFRPIEETDAQLADEHFRAKAESLATLQALLRDDPPSLWLLVSSLSAILGGLGMAAYAGANAYLDASAARHDGEDGAAWLSVNWDGWDFAATESHRAIAPDDGLEALARLLAARGPAQMVVSVGDLHARLEQWIALRSIRSAPAPDAPAADTPHLQIRTTASPADGSEVEQFIASIWQELLGVRQVRPHDNFFELGGHSLLAIQLISRLRDAFHIEVSVHSIFERPTVAALAQHIESQRSAEEAARLEQMVALVEGLSDEEVNALLNGQGEP